jgi:hypothetical protein
MFHQDHQSSCHGQLFCFYGPIFLPTRCIAGLAEFSLFLPGHVIQLLLCRVCQRSLARP